MARSAVGVVLQHTRGGDSAAKTAPPSGEAVAKRFNALGPALKAALAAKGPDLARVQKLAVAVNGHLKAKDFARAGGALDELEPLLKTASGDRAAEARAEIPTGTVAAGVLRGELQVIRQNAARGLSALAGKLQAETDPRAKEVEAVVAKMAQALPANLEAALGQLNAAVESGDTAGAVTAKAGVQQAAAEWTAYLDAHAHEIRCCEDNPWGLAVAIDQPVRASLAAVLKATR